MPWELGISPLCSELLLPPFTLLNSSVWLLLAAFSSRNCEFNSCFPCLPGNPEVTLLRWTRSEGSGQQRGVGTSLWFGCARQGKSEERNSLVLILGKEAAQSWVAFGEFCLASQLVIIINPRSLQGACLILPGVQEKIRANEINFILLSRASLPNIPFPECFCSMLLCVLWC